MSKMNVRIRQLDCHKKLKIFRTLDQLPNEECTQNAPSSSNSRIMPQPYGLGKGKGKQPVITTIVHQKKRQEDNFKQQQKQVELKLNQLKQKIVIPETQKIQISQESKKKVQESLPKEQPASLKDKQEVVFKERPKQYIKYMGPRTITNSTFTLLDIAFGEQINPKIDDEQDGEEQDKFQVDMEANDDDIQFIQNVQAKFNKGREEGQESPFNQFQIDVQKFEFIIDTFQKVQGFDDTKPQSMVPFLNCLSMRDPSYAQVNRLSRPLIQEIYNYWWKKCEQSQSSFLRKFWRRFQKSGDGIFTPHSQEKRNLRKKRSDQDQQEILKSVLKTLSKTNELTNDVIKRENQKFNLIKLDRLEFLQRSNIINGNEQFDNKQFTQYKVQRKKILEKSKQAAAAAAKQETEEEIQKTPKKGATKNKRPPQKPHQYDNNNLNYNIRLQIQAQKMKLPSGVYPIPNTPGFSQIPKMIYSRNRNNFFLGPNKNLHYTQWRRHLPPRHLANQIFKEKLKKNIQDAPTIRYQARRTVFGLQIDRQINHPKFFKYYGTTSTMIQLPRQLKVPAEEYMTQQMSIQQALQKMVSRKYQDYLPHVDNQQSNDYMSDSNNTNPHFKNEDDKLFLHAQKIKSIGKDFKKFKEQQNKANKESVKKSLIPPIA